MVNKRMGTTVNAVWLVIVPCILLGFLAFASYAAIASIFSLAAVGMDLSYIVPIFCRQIWADHPEVNFVPGPFTLGKGWVGRVVNAIAVIWTLFEVTVLCFPITASFDASTLVYEFIYLRRAFRLPFSLLKKYYANSPSHLLQFFPLVLSFNYASVLTGAVVILTTLWYAVYARHHYSGPISTLAPEQLEKLGVVTREGEEPTPHH